MRRLRSFLPDRNLYSAGALIAAVMASAFFVAILLSPGAWQWWNAVAVHGNEQSGVVSYTYRGHNYSLDDTNSMATRTRTVYLNPDDPSAAVLNIEVARISDSVITGGLYLVALGFLVAAVRRRRTRDRRSRGDHSDRFGGGIDPEFVQRIISSRTDRPSRG
ncbi:MAG TPA: hypothetical protein VG435_18800 [Acidimicrobiales bacterium]|nr:hypothetical protein [Acidimicrobiales bacterium]